MMILNKLLQRELAYMNTRMVLIDLMKNLSDISCFYSSLDDSVTVEQCKYAKKGAHSS